MSENRIKNLERKLEEVSQLLTQLVSDTAYAASWDTITAIAPSKNAIYDKIVAILTLMNNYISPTLMYGMEGFAMAGAESWSVASSDVNAYMQFNFVVPETRNDWKITLVTVNSGIVSNSGKLYLGAAGSGETYSDTNIFNGINFDLIHVVGNQYLYTTSSAFSATLGDLLAGSWGKDANEGASALYFFAVYLWHA